MAKDCTPRLTRPQLRARGWTDAMIRDLLGEPDATHPNPIYKSAAPMALYDQQRVHEVEAGEEFAARREKARRRSAAGKAVAERKRRETLAAIRAVPVKVKLPGTLDEATEKAIEHYNARLRQRERWYEDTPASIDSDPAFLRRITVNYLRHKCSSYERTLERETERLAGRVGVRELYPHVKRRVLDVIAERFPDLYYECLRQMQE